MRTKAKQYLKTRDLCERYRVVEKSIQRMRADGRLPEPDMWNGRSPLWSEESLDRHDRRQTVRRRS
jgi:hypothetical protein